MKSITRKTTKRQNAPASAPTFAERIAAARSTHRGGSIRDVVNSTAEDLLCLVGLLEHDPNTNIPPTAIRQLLEIQEQLFVVVDELERLTERDALRHMNERSLEAAAE